MKSSNTVGGLKFKSPLRTVVGFLFRSRETKANKCRELKQQLDQARAQLSQRQAEIERHKQENTELKQQVQRLEIANRLQARQPGPLPSDPPLKDHSYGVRLITLAVNLAPLCGLRGAAQALKIFCVAGRRTADSSLDDDPHVAATGRRGGAERADRTG